jgi:hypothetical protein
MKKIFILFIVVLGILLIGCSQKIDGEVEELNYDWGKAYRWSTMSSNGEVAKYYLILPDSSLSVKKQLVIKKYRDVLTYLSNNISEENEIENPKVGNITKQGGKVISIQVEGKTYKK